MAEDNGFAMGYALGQDNNGGGNSGFGGNFGEGLWAVIILAILFGRGGFGGLGGFGGGGGGGSDCCCGVATQADLAAGFNNSAVLNNLNDLKLGQAGIQQTLCQGFNGINTTVLQGFNGVDNAVCTLGYNFQSGINGISREIADCCCTTQRLMERGFCDVGQAINMQTRDIIDNQNANYRGIMDFMVQSKMDALRSENEALRLRASQADQNAVLRAAIDASTAEIIRRTGNECPVPAYVVPNPNCCYGNPVGIGYGGNGGCGCGC